MATLSRECVERSLNGKVNGRSTVEDAIHTDEGHCLEVYKESVLELAFRNERETIRVRLVKRAKQSWQAQISDPHAQAQTSTGGVTITLLP